MSTFTSHQTKKTVNNHRCYKYIDTFCLISRMRVDVSFVAENENGLK